MLFSFILYYLILLPISYLPFWFLYRLSDITYYIIYYLVGYRKEEVFFNLKNSFPEKSDEEIRRIAKKYYKHLCDILFEAIKAFTITEKQIKKRMKPDNPELMEKLFKNKKSALMVSGHFNNWEYIAVGLNKLFKHKGLGIYKPLTNKFFNNKMLRTRSRMGMALANAEGVKDLFQQFKDKVVSVAIYSDQSPSDPEKSYWMKFLNQDTPVLFGVEYYAVKYDYAVVYMRVDKVTRGYYAIYMRLITDEPKGLAYGEITEAHTRMLEDSIKQAPEYWLWSHRRWKHKMPKKIRA